MASMTLKIDQLIIDTDVEQGATGTIRQVVDEAFERLARQLAQSPFARWAPLNEIALQRVEVSTLSADELLGPRGAERLADELYTQLTERF
jgi:hypothetical protein